MMHFVVQLDGFFEAYPTNGQFWGMWHWDEVGIIKFNLSVRYKFLKSVSVFLSWGKPDVISHMLHSDGQ